MENRVEEKPRDVRSVVLGEMATMARIKAFLVAGKSPVGVYLLYTQNMRELHLTDEQTKEMQAEIKGRLQFAWIEVRKKVLDQYGVTITGRKLAQKFTPAVGTVLNPKLAAVMSAYQKAGDSQQEKK